MRHQDVNVTATRDGRFHISGNGPPRIITVKAGESIKLVEGERTLTFSSVTEIAPKPEPKYTTVKITKLS